MPWKETCAVDERRKFIERWLDQEEPFAVLCAEFGISRKTGYKWLERFKENGREGLDCRSRAPLHHPNAVSGEVEEEILSLRRRRPHWGPKKLLARLEVTEPDLDLPSRSTVARMLNRNGLASERRRRRHGSPTPPPLTDSSEDTVVWSIDFKGHFALGNGELCYPLTVCDHSSRFILRCQRFANIRLTNVAAVTQRLFRDHGLPHVIRSDNGVPFASTSLAGLNRLNIEWIKLGILPERIASGRPEQNGRHERMHRDLKAQTANPPKTTAAAQQRAFDAFCQEYNYERPHEALGQRPPVEFYRPSQRPYPRRPPQMHYPDDYRVRRICEGGQLRWCGEKIFITHTLAHEPVGLDQIEDGLWALYFGPIKLGHLDERGKTTAFKATKATKKKRTSKVVQSPPGATEPLCKPASKQAP